MKNFLTELTSGVLILLGIVVLTTGAEQMPDPLGYWVFVAGGAMITGGLDWRISTAIREKRSSDGR